MKKNISILGSTGSIGKNTLNVIRKFRDDFVIKAISAHSNIDLLEKQAREFHPELIAVFDEKKAVELKKRVPDIKVVSGMEGLIESVTLDSVDFVMTAISGSIGLLPIVSAIKARKSIGLANKEVLVCAGEYISTLVKKMKVPLLPVDSEHCAIFQCIGDEDKRSIKRLILTASGGPFRNYSKQQLDNITLEEALKHPTYSMGAKITIDSSTLMNKGLEVIEAHFLFGIPFSEIQAVIHPQSIVHSMVEFVDGSILAQMGLPNMEVPIQYALSYPERKNSCGEPFDFIKNSKLEFFAPDMEKFPCLMLAYEALKTGKSMLCYMNGANEVLVERFLKKEISWKDIPIMLEKLMSSHKIQNVLDLDAILEIDKEAKSNAQKIRV